MLPGFCILLLMMSMSFMFQLANLGLGGVDKVELCSLRLAFPGPACGSLVLLESRVRAVWMLVSAKLLVDLQNIR